MNDGTKEVVGAVRCCFEVKHIQVVIALAVEVGWVIASFAALFYLFTSYLIPYLHLVASPPQGPLVLSLLQFRCCSVGRYDAKLKSETDFESQRSPKQCFCGESRHIPMWSRFYSDLQAGLAADPSFTGSWVHALCKYLRYLRQQVNVIRSGNLESN